MFLKMSEKLKSKCENGPGLIFQETPLCHGARGQVRLLPLDRLRLLGRQDPPGAPPGVGGRGRHHHSAKEVIAHR